MAYQGFSSSLRGVSAHLLATGETLQWVGCSIMTRPRPRFSPSESTEWLHARMAEMGLATLEELSAATGIDRGTLSRYFRQERRPSIDVVAPLTAALQVSPETMLIVLGALDRRG